MKTKILSYTFFIILVLLLSCAEENPDLVTPPPQSETVKVRFFNLAGDGNQRVLSLENQLDTPEIPYGNISQGYQPPSDSTFIIIKNNGNIEYPDSLKKRRKFSRNLNYTFIALPSAENEPDDNPVDTVMSIISSSIIRDDDPYAYIKLFNASPNSDVKYTMTLGCPNGEILAASVRYRRSSVSKQVRTGKVPVSILRIDSVSSESIGLFELDLSARDQKVVFITGPGTSPGDVFVLDQMDITIDALEQAAYIDDSNLLTGIRAISFSDEPLDIIKEPGEIIAQQIQPMTVGEYADVIACSSQYADSVSVYLNGDTASTYKISLEVLDRYSFLVFDNETETAANTFMVEPLRLLEELDGRSLIRVVHADYTNEAIDISLGARTVAGKYIDESDSLRNYRAGEEIAGKIYYGDMSNYKILPSGYAPITIFSSTKPIKLLHSAIFDLEPDTKYIMVVMHDKSSREMKVSMIKDYDADETVDYTGSKTVEFLDEGIFATFVNATAGLSQAKISIDPGIGDNILKDAILPFTGSLATVLPAGSHSLNMAGVTKNYNVETGNRILAFSAGTQAEIEIFTIIEEPMNPTPFDYRRRFINAAPEYQTIGLKETEVDSINPFLWVDYGQATDPPQAVTLDRKFSLFFTNQNNEIISRAADLNLPFNKAYSIIFAGHSKYYDGKDPEKAYSAIIQQEY